MTDNQTWQPVIEVNDVPLTCFSPDRQVFILLNVQHELESITHTSLGGDEGRTSIFPGVKGVTLPIASEDLREKKEREICFNHRAAKLQSVS